MRRSVIDLAWITLIGGIMFFTNLGVAGLWDEDEPIYASCAREMIQRSDWVVPTYNGEVFPDKPPLMFWTMMAGFALFGFTELGARFFSPVLAILAAWTTYELGRRLFSRRVGLWGAIITSSTILFTISARAATVDAALTLFTASAMLGFVLAYGKSLGLTREEEGAPAKCAARTAQGSPSAPAKHWGVWLMWASMAMAVLAKGPIGLLLPAAAIGLFLMIAGRPNRQPVDAPWWKRAVIVTAQVWYPLNFLRAFRQMRPVVGVVALLVITVPWFVWVGLRTDGAWLHEFFAMYNLRPFAEPILGHQGPVWYHVGSLLGGFFPWSVFIGLVFYDSVRRLRERDPRRDAHIFCFTWLGIWFVFWSVCSTKLPHYLLPAFPAVGLLTAVFLDGWLRQPQRATVWLMKTAMAITIAVGVGVMVAMPIVASIWAPGVGWLGSTGLILIIGGAAGWCLLPHRRRQLVPVFAAMSVAAMTAVFALATNVVDRYQNARPMLAEIRSRCLTEPDLAGFRYLQESVVFYAGEPIAYCEDPATLEAFLAEADCPVVLTRGEQLPELRKQFGPRLVEIARYRYFPHDTEVVVLTPRDALASFRPADPRYSPAARTAGTMPHAGTTWR